MDEGSTETDSCYQLLQPAIFDVDEYRLHLELLSSSESDVCHVSILDLGGDLLDNMPNEMKKPIVRKLTQMTNAGALQQPKEMIFQKSKKKSSESFSVPSIEVKSKVDKAPSTPQKPKKTAKKHLQQSRTKKKGRSLELENLTDLLSPSFQPIGSCRTRKQAGHYKTMVTGIVNGEKKIVKEKDSEKEEKRKAANEKRRLKRLQDGKQTSQKVPGSAEKTPEAVGILEESAEVENDAVKNSGKLEENLSSPMEVLADWPSLPMPIVEASDCGVQVLGVSLEPSKEDLDLFEEVRCRALISALIPPVILEPCSAGHEPATKSEGNSSGRKFRRKAVVEKPPKLLQLGDKKYRTLYSSFASRADAIRGDCIYMCEFCLRQFDSVRFLGEHYESCAWHSPPGNILYRDTSEKSTIVEGEPGTVQEEFVIYEIDGRDWVLYCQRLALLGKLFIQSKNLLYEVEHFYFYVLCYRNQFGDHVMGYFSKDKAKVPDCFNLSCIVVLPPYQGKGYGKLLVEFSYLLSEVNVQPGAPEKPLSEEGERTYKSVWKRKLLEALWQRKKENAPRTSLNDLAGETGMCAEDVAGILIELKVLVPVEERTTKRTRRSTPRRARQSWAVDMNADELSKFTEAMEEGVLPKKIMLDGKKLLHQPKKQREEGEAA